MKDYTELCDRLNREEITFDSLSVSAIAGIMREHYRGTIQEEELVDKLKEYLGKQKGRAMAVRKCIGDKTQAHIGMDLSQ